MFETDPNHAHRRYQERKAARPIKGNMSEFAVTLAKKVECPDCNARPGYPCLGLYGKNQGKKLNGVHARRHGKAWGIFRRRK